MAESTELMPLFILMALCAALLPWTNAPARGAALESPETTLLFVKPSGSLCMANVAARETRLPDGSLAPGHVVRRVVVSPDGEHALFETANAGGVCSAWVLHLPTRRVRALGAGLLLPSGGPGPFAPDSRRVALRRQNRDEVVVLSLGTGGVLSTLRVPGIQDAPAWFSDGRHIAVAAIAPNGGSSIALYSAATGALLRQAIHEEPGVRYHCERALTGRLLYRETREGVDSWQAIPAAGEAQPADEPAAPPLPADLPGQVQAVLSPNGAWVAYIHEGYLCVRSSEEGFEAARLAPAVSLLWKPGSLLSEAPERIPVPPPVPGVGPAPVAVIPGLLTVRAGAAEVVEGTPLQVTWEVGKRVAAVRLSAFVQRTPKGPVKRGTYSVPIGRVAASRGRCSWPVPWLDNIRFGLRAEALDAAGKVLGRVERPLRFRPRQLANRRDDGIYVHLSQPDRQRLYVQEGGVLTMVALCSGSSTRRLLPPNQHPDDPHDHYGTFQVLGKDPDHVSNLNDDWRMPFAMRYLAGHFIHVTARNQYYRLGRPGSHGCVRLHREDGVRIYGRTKIGETVVVY